MKLLVTFLLLASAAGAQTLVDRALVKFQESGQLAQGGKYDDANRVLREAYTLFDQAVAEDPQAYRPRLLRGINYSFLPGMFGKTAQAYEDLTWVMAHADFANEPADRQELIFQRLKALKPAHTKPDRFPDIGPEVSPVICSATVTITGNKGEIPPDLKAFIDRMKTHTGLLETHTLHSLDRPGMLVILTSWKNKQALNDWFYSDVHQGMIREIYQKPTGAPQTTSGTTQVGIELFTVLAGGRKLGGGLFGK